MRAKFIVDSIKITTWGREATLRAVSDTSPENNQFAQATPAGEIKMTITNPAAYEYLEVGASYYVDFTQAPK